MMGKRISVRVAVLALAACLGFAGDNVRAMDAAEVRKLTAALGLPAAQAAQVEKLYVEWSAKAEPLRARRRATEAELTALRATKPRNALKIAAKEKELEAILAESAPIWVDHDRALHKILGAQQYAKFGDIRSGLELTAALGLAPEQAAAVVRLYLETYAKREPVIARLRAADAELTVLRAATPPDSPKIAAKEQELRAIASEMKPFFADREKALQKILGAEQYAKSEEIRFGLKRPMKK